MNLPGNVQRASAYAARTPNGRLKAVAVSAIWRDNRTAVHSSGESSNTAYRPRPTKSCGENIAVPPRKGNIAGGFGSGRRGEVNAVFGLTANRIPPAVDGG